MDKRKSIKKNAYGFNRTNRKHKDRLFRLVFSEKKDLLELYNAINGTAYQNEEDLEINTIEDVIYMGLKNDLSFLIGNSLNLYEHQSTDCGNLPLRGLFYLSVVYRRYVKQKGYNLYGNGMVKIPFPQYIVFYNGKKEDAVERAMDECMREDVLKELLEKNRWEVLNVILTEYDEAQHMETMRREGREEGKVEGRTETLIEMMIELLALKMEVPEAIKKQIQEQTDIDKLKAWFKAAATCECMEEFEKKIAEI